MSDALESWEELGVATALAQRYSEDSRGFLPLLASVLSATLPNETTVERKGGLFQKEKPVHKVVIAFGEHQFQIENTGQGPLATRRLKIVRGITLKTEPMPVEVWLKELCTEIQTRTDQSEKAFFALKDLLG